MDANLLLFDVPSESPQHKSELEINNPFDECDWIANHNTEILEDPFDIVTQKINKFNHSLTNNLLINMNGSCESSNNLNLSNKSLNSSNKSLNSSVDRSVSKSTLSTPRSVKMAHKLVKSTPSPVTLKRDRVSSDSSILKMTQGKNLLEKLRETTSLDNDTLVCVTKKTHEILCPSFAHGDTSCEDLNSTMPKWIDLEADDVSDIETLTIPFLKENESFNLGENGPESSGEHHTKLEMNTILANIKKSNENEEKQLFINNLESSVGEFMKKFEVTKNCDKIMSVLKSLIDLLEGKDIPVDDSSKSAKIIRQETFDLPKKTTENVKVPTQLPSSSKKPSRTSLNVSARESLSHRSAVTTPKAKVRASISHLSASKKENRSPSANVARRSLYATPSKSVKPVIEVPSLPSVRLRLRSKTQTLSTAGPLKALEPSRTSTIPPKITVTSNSSNISEHHNSVISSSTPIQAVVPRRQSMSRIATPAKTPIGKGIPKIATPSRLSKLHTPSRIRTTLGEFNAP